MLATKWIRIRPTKLSVARKTKENFLWEIAKSELEAKYEILGTDEVIAQFQRMAILKAIDENWVEQVDYLQQLRMALSGQYTSQKNPLVEFFQEAYQSFERMKEAAKRTNGPQSLTESSRNQ